MQVMLGGKNIEEGFGIAYRVIQVCFQMVLFRKVKFHPELCLHAEASIGEYVITT